MKFSVLLVGTLFLAGLAACDNSSSTPGDDDTSTQPDGAPADAITPTPESARRSGELSNASASTGPTNGCAHSWSCPLPHRRRHPPQLGASWPGSSAAEALTFRT